MRNVQEAASERLQRPLQIAAISIPHHFNDSSAFAVIEAFKEVEPAYKQPMQVIRSGAAAWLAYELNTCEAFGLNHNTCDIDEDSHRIIIVEYRENYLQLFIAEVGAETCNINTNVRYGNLGEDAILDAFANDSVQERIRQKILHNQESDAAKNIRMEHYAKIEYTLSDFLMEQESATRDFDWWDIVRAVVISGDASELGMQRLRSCVDNALRQHQVQTLDSIDPLYVEAMGAAQRGRQLILNPRLLDDMVFSLIPEHDEL